MSYEKVKSFSFSKDFRTLTTTSASSNCFPIDYNKCISQAKEDITTHDFIKMWVDTIIGGTLQFNNKNHYIQFVIDTILTKNSIESHRTLWAAPYDFNAEFSQELKKYVFENTEDETAYHAAKQKAEAIKEEITTAILNGSLKNRYKELKKEKYLLTDGYSYLTSKGNRGFRSSGSKDRAKIFNGLNLTTMKSYFAITKYNYHFELLEA